MDTKAWGPEAWIFTHKLTSYYEPTPQKKKIYFCFFHKLGDILPCKYCRFSYREFITELPPIMTNRKALMNWYREMHNKVNNKLRKQGQNVAPDPSFSEVYHKYLYEINFIDFIQSMWDFLYAIVYNYPINGGQECKKNYIQFFTILQQILPSEYNLQQLFINYFSWNEFIAALKSRNQLKIWLFKFEKRIQSHLKNMWGIITINNNKNFEQIDSKYENWRATCSKGTCSKDETSTSDQCFISVY